jgi:hypothetical protein
LSTPAFALQESQIPSKAMREFFFFDGTMEKAVWLIIVD